MGLDLSILIYVYMEKTVIERLLNRLQSVNIEIAKRQLFVVQLSQFPLVNGPKLLDLHSPIKSQNRTDMTYFY